MNKEEFDKVNVFGQGELNVSFAKYFIGNSYLNPLTKKRREFSFFNKCNFRTRLQK